MPRCENVARSAGVNGGIPSSKITSGSKSHLGRFEYRSKSYAREAGRN